MNDLLENRSKGSCLLHKKNALITGGSRGIGKAIAERFVQEGASVALFGTNISSGEETVAYLKTLVSQKEQRVLFYQVDVRDGEQVRTRVQEVITAFGTLDILVNNAGVTRDQLLMRMSEDEWDAVLDTNLKSVYHMCSASIRSMMKARQGKIINITSIVGLIGNSGQTNYAASKAGLIGFTKSLAKEVGSRNICVNCIAPGFIQTDMTAVLDDKQKEYLLSQITLGTLGQPQDIAAAALFLATANYITGQVLTVDGGMT